MTLECPLMTLSGHCCEFNPAIHYPVLRMCSPSWLRRLAREVDAKGQLRAAQCGGDCEKAFTRTTPPTIRASPISAGTSGVCRNQNHPTKAIKTMPRPDHIA